MKNIHVLPTPKPSRLLYYLKDNSWDLFNYPMPKIDNVVCQHIYITSNEEIKKGDIVKIPCGVGKVRELNWKYGNDFPSYVVEDIFTYKLRYGQKESELQINSFNYENVKKIILTTDPDIIKNGLQSIPDDFLEWFVKNPICEWIEYDKKYNRGNGKYYYKIIIPEKKPNIIDEFFEINEFVPYQQALALKELGFDEPCFGYYLNEKLNIFHSTSVKDRINSKTKDIFSSVETTSPLYQQVFRWFREKYDLYGTIRYGYNEFDKSVFLFPCINGISGNNSFGKQEEAELECLKKLIEIAKENK